MRRPPARRIALLTVLVALFATPAAAQRSCYGLLSFPESPTPVQREAFARRGVHVLSYFRDDLYRVRLTPCRRGEPLAESAGSLIELVARDRVAADIWDGRFAAYQVVLPDSTTLNRVLNPDGTLNLIITFHEGVADEEMQAVLQTHAGGGRRISGERWLVRIPATVLEPLASEQVVQWIDAGPMPYLPDN